MNKSQQSNERISLATAQRRNEEGANFIDQSSLRRCAVVGEILLVT
jgi:hypothetical protein